MLRKLYSLVSGSSCADNPDSPQHHEVLLPGFLYGMIIKERFDDCLGAVKAQIQQDIRQNKKVDFVNRTSSPESADSSPILFQRPRQSQLGYRSEAIVLSRHRKPRLAHRAGSPTDQRLHHCGGKTKLLPIPGPFQVYSSRCIFRRAQDDDSQETLARVLG